MTSPLLTYIVPLYNTEAYVQRCLQSIVDQGLEEDQYEVLVVDDIPPSVARLYHYLSRPVHCTVFIII